MTKRNHKLKATPPVPKQQGATELPDIPEDADLDKILWGNYGIEPEDVDRVKRELLKQRSPIHRPPTPSKLLRQAFFQAITEKDVRDITRALIERAKEGDINAARLLFDRGMGRLAVTSNVKFQEERTVNVQIRHLSDHELIQLEALAVKALPPPED